MHIYIHTYICTLSETLDMGILVRFSVNMFFALISSTYSAMHSNNLELIIMGLNSFMIFLNS